MTWAWFVAIFFGLFRFLHLGLHGPNAGDEVVPVVRVQNAQVYGVLPDLGLRDGPDSHADLPLREKRRKGVPGQRDRGLEIGGKEVLWDALAISVEHPCQVSKVVAPRPVF